jgi:type I restriction enzyme R subunit
MFHGFDYGRFFTGTAAERIGILAAAMDFILTEPAPQKSDKRLSRNDRYMQAVTELSKAFALVATHEDAIAIREEVAFFQCIRAQLAKMTPTDGKTSDQLDTAIRQIISRAVASDEVIDIFAAAGLNKPNIAILSDEFLAEVQGIPHKRLALEVLKKLLNDEIKFRSRKKLVESRSFAEMLEATVRRYQNRSIDAAQVIAELVHLAKDMREAHRRGEQLGLTDDEIAFYDALEVNNSAVKILGDETLRAIARELVDVLRRNVTIDWTVKENVRAKLRTMVKKVLRRHGYPPDQQEKAVQTVLQQAELLCNDWN